jgi:hypothetical protein
MTDKTNLDAMLNAIIGDNPETAQVNFHTYLRDKMQTQFGIGQPHDQAPAAPQSTDKE